MSLPANRVESSPSAITEGSPNRGTQVRPAAGRLPPMLARLNIRSAAVRVWLFNVSLGAAAAIGILVIVANLQPVPSAVHVPWPLLALAFLAAETKVIVVHFRRETHSFSLSE